MVAFVKIDYASLTLPMKSYKNYCICNVKGCKCFAPFKINAFITRSRNSLSTFLLVVIIYLILYVDVNELLILVNADSYFSNLVEKGVKFNQAINNK